ncbi:MAG: hypothetical protein ACRECD_13995 [Burkholderiaceae bacterium]
MLWHTMNQNTVQAVTLAIAVLGAVLGLMNTWRNWSADRLRLRVNVSMAVLADGSQALCVEALNLSSFPVTVTHFGFTLLGSDSHMQFMPIFPRGESLPVRLESRTSCTALCAPWAHKEAKFAGVDCAYVNTACGNQIKGGGAFLAHLALNAAAAQV